MELPVILFLLVTTTLTLCKVLKLTDARDGVHIYHVAAYVPKDSRVATCLIDQTGVMTPEGYMELLETVRKDLGCESTADFHIISMSKLS